MIEKDLSGLTLTLRAATEGPACEFTPHHQNDAAHPHRPTKDLRLLSAALHHTSATPLLREPSGS